MSLLEWDESFSVNDPAMDDQHRQWLVILNGLHDRIEGGGKSGATGGEIVTLKAMMEYARNHFLAEERHMRKIGFPETVAHIKAHNECYGRISTHLLTAESGGRVATAELLDFLKEWLMDHILHEDMKYGVHAASGK